MVYDVGNTSQPCGVVTCRLGTKTAYTYTTAVNSLIKFKTFVIGPGSVLGIVTAYGLDGPGIESRGARFSASVQTGPEAHSASCTMGQKGLSLG